MVNPGDDIEHYEMKMYRLDEHLSSSSEGLLLMMAFRLIVTIARRAVSANPIRTTVIMPRFRPPAVASQRNEISVLLLALTVNFL